MDLASIGTKLIVIFTICVLSHGQIYIEQGEDSSYQRADIYDVENEHHHVTGDIFIIDNIVADEEHALQDFFENILEKENEIFVKICGNAISIIKDSPELRSILRFERTGTCDLDSDILEVLQVAKKSVHIYIITGQYSDGSEITETLINQIKDKDIRIDTIRLDQEHAIYSNFRSRHKRQINFYQHLANISGGSVINTNKQNIGSALNLIKQSIKTSLVHVMRFADHSSPGKVFRIPVDDTMTQFIFRVQVERSNPVIIATMPSGIPPSAHPILLGKASAGTVIAILETNLTKPTDYGTWKISKLDFNIWDIKVDGQSRVDFTHEFLEPGASGFGEYPIKGRPIIGNTYKLSITVPEYDKVQIVRMGMFFIREKLMPIDMKSLKNVGGRRGKSIFYESFTIPPKDFMVGIEGTDKSGHMFRRVDPLLITPVGLKLVIPSLAGVKFYQNDTLAIPFTVINKGSKEQDVDVKIEDDKKFAQPPYVLSATIKPGENFTGTFIIKAGLTVGETTTVTINAKPYLGHSVFSQGQFEIRRFTVMDKNITTTTLSTPTTTTLSTSSTSTSSSTSTTSSTIPTTVSTSLSKLSPASSSKASSSSSTKVSSNPTSANTPQTVTGSVTTKVLSSTIKSSLKTGQTNVPTSSASTPSSQKSSTKPVTGQPSTGPTSKSSAKPSTPKTTTAKTVPTSPSPILKQTIGTTTTAAPQSNNKESDKTDIPATSVVIGISTGAIVGIAAMGTMALLFRKALKKAGKSVGPTRRDEDFRRRQSNLAWT